MKVCKLDRGICSAQYSKSNDLNTYCLDKNDCVHQIKLDNKEIVKIDKNNSQRDKT